MKNPTLSLITVLIVATSSVVAQDQAQKIGEVYNIINHLYVDDVPSEEIGDAAIVAMLEELDPHSTYIPKSDVEGANERINGSFVGIGIRFQLLNDTLLVVNPIPGGVTNRR